MGGKVSVWQQSMRVEFPFMRHKQYFGLQHPSETVSPMLAPIQSVSQSRSGSFVVVGAVGKGKKVGVEVVIL